MVAMTRVPPRMGPCAWSCAFLACRIMANPTVVDEGEKKPFKEMHHRNEETELSLSLDLPQVFVLYSLYG